jgi:hypothetical protein
MFVLAIVTVPAVNTPVPMKSVTAPPWIARYLAAPLIFRSPLAVISPVIVIPPEPEAIVVADVVLVDPNTAVLAAPPVATWTTVAEASELIERAPTPELMVRAPPVEVIARAPDPHCTVVEDVELVEPKVTPLTAPPVASETVVADASVLIPRAPVPELIVRVPPVEVTARAPEPD